MGSDAAEFVNKVKDQVRNRQKRMSNVAESGEEHSIIWRMFMAATLNAATFMGKNFVEIQNSIMNSRDLTLKHMFGITAKLVSDQDEINGLDNIHWRKNSWRQLSLIGDETVINLERTKVYVFSDSVLCIGKIHENLPIKRCMGTKQLDYQTMNKHLKFCGMRFAKAGARLRPNWSSSRHRFQ